jgi:PadR family transcriptional regulator, regulatory protein PadR
VSRHAYSASMPGPDLKLVTREILQGFWKVHILHHAAEHPVVGQWMLAELRHHGYEISPGTLYPLLKRMERNGWLRCAVEKGAGPRAPRFYTLTKLGRAVLTIVSAKVGELRHETHDGPAARDKRLTPATRRRRPESRRRSS